MTGSKNPTLNRVQVVPLVGQALPPANRSGSDQELAGESACPTFFHGISRAEGPSQQTTKAMVCPTGHTNPRREVAFVKNSMWRFCMAMQNR
jgi:hypothetical protein